MMGRYITNICPYCDGETKPEECEPDYEPDDWGDEAADFGGMDIPDTRF